jgi:hypothetical protein
MHYYYKTLVTGVLVFFSMIGVVSADGVFVDKTRDRHGLSAGEQRQIAVEYARRFGAPGSANYVRSNNPWEAKKQRAQASRSVTWGECRDYALQQRNLCYKQGRDAYNCERFYEARSHKCDKDY